MTDLLWLVPALPFAGFVLLALAGRRLGRQIATWIGVGSVGLSAAAAVALAAGFGRSAAAGEALTRLLWRWFDVGGLHPGIGLYLDPLAIVMTLVVTGVGFLIHLYSAEFMAEDTDVTRFFAYMNLFVGAMLTLVLADDLLLLYLGWEGVGLASYLLIGFWYDDPANGRAARKAFVVTRVGDAAMALGLFLLFLHLGTLNIQEVLARAGREWSAGSGLAVAVAALLLGGAVGKSAQLPLQTWLPDAMAGPTPVSALIHAATMVTAGVYLIARTHVLFELAPPVMAAVAVVGAATLLVAGFSALAQRDIKRILAYSTISQIGYMFLALGVGAWSAAIFHLMTHAFFKALLFLGAGAVILALHHEHDIFEMGGLRREMPVTFWTFLAASGALAGFPLVTAGFYSKDLILWEAWSSSRGSAWLWAAGLVGALLTGLYIFRLVFVAFFGETKMHPERLPGWKIRLPLIVLGVLSIVGGLVELPPSLGDLPLFSRFLGGTFARPLPPEAAGVPHGAGTEIVLELAAAAVVLLGIGLAYRWFFPRRGEAVRESPPGVAAPVQRFWFAGWGFDRLYDILFVRPWVALARLDRNDVVDLPYRGLAALARLGFAALRPSQNGRLRWYAAGLVVGTVLVFAMVVFL